MYGAYHITNMMHPDGQTEVVDVVGSLCENNIQILVKIVSYLKQKLVIY